jgi:hypothetical protein
MTTHTDAAKAGGLLLPKQRSISASMKLLRKLEREAMRDARRILDELLNCVGPVRIGARGVTIEGTIPHTLIDQLALIGCKLEEIEEAADDDGEGETDWNGDEQDDDTNNQ